MHAPSRLTLPRSALAHLRRDAKLARIIEAVGPCRIEVGRAETHLLALVRSIVYQQLSGKAAATILARVRAELGAHRVPGARDVLALDVERLRAAGLSRQKIASLVDLCTRVESGELALDAIDRLDDAAIVERLVAVRGIGVWSAQMFLLFHLGRLDVWATGDLGLRKAVARIQRRAELPSPKEMERAAAPWAPYRSVASWYLWRSLDLADDGGAGAGW